MSAQRVFAQQKISFNYFIIIIMFNKELSYIVV